MHTACVYVNVARSLAENKNMSMPYQYYEYTYFQLQFDTKLYLQLFTIFKRSNFFTF